jgi:hypothetical protein
MNSPGKTIVAFALLTLLIGVAVTPCIATGTSAATASTDETEEQLLLLRGEHYLYLNASDDVGGFHLRFSFPPDHAYQVPVMLEIHNDTTADIVHHHLEDDIYKPNIVINFTLGAMSKDESVLLHFSCWVLVKNHTFDDLPAYVEIPKKCELPEEVKIWLASTEVVQTRSMLIKLKARQLRGRTDNLLQFAHKIARFIKMHRYILFILELNLGLFLSQDALTTLFINGENVGRSHLGCALLRSQNVPARVLLAHNDQGFWTQMHYMFEYYLPSYGWVLIDSTKGATPYATGRQIINRVCYPADEEDTKPDYIYPLMKGEERWLWIDTEQVYPYYVNCSTGSKSMMFNESSVFAETFTVDYAKLLTQMVFHQYEQYLGMNLTGGNLQHFQNATGYQKQAINALAESNDLDDYLFFMDQAFDEYKQIDF